MTRGLLSLPLEMPARCVACGEVYDLAVKVPASPVCCGLDLDLLTEAYVCTGCRTNHLDPAAARECCPAAEGAVR